MEKIYAEGSRSVSEEELYYSNYDTPGEMWTVTDLDGLTSSYDPVEQERINRINGRVRVLKRKYDEGNN